MIVAKFRKPELGENEAPVLVAITSRMNLSLGKRKVSTLEYRCLKKLLDSMPGGLVRDDLEQTPGALRTPAIPDRINGTVVIARHSHSLKTYAQTPESTARIDNRPIGDVGEVPSSQMFTIR